MLISKIDLKKENKNKNIDLFLKAKNLSYKIILEELDCEKSFLRQKSNLTFENIYNILLEKNNFPLYI